MTGFALTVLSTLLVMAVYAALGAVVSRARGKFGVLAPMVTGHPDFERRYRVHMNTLEQLPILLPLMWLTAWMLGDAWGALGGLVFAVGRILYARAYYENAARRDIGFTVSAVPMIAMFVAVLIAIGVHWR